MIIMAFENCYGREYDVEDANCKACCVAKECARLKNIPDAKIQQAPLEMFFQTVEKKYALKYTPRSDGFIARSDGLEIDVRGGLVTVKRGESVILEPTYLLSIEDAEKKAEVI